MLWACGFLELFAKGCFILKKLTWAQADKCKESQKCDASTWERLLNR